MSERYLPSSEFLNYVVADEITFDDTIVGQANLAQLLGLVTDDDRVNRDWAAFLIAGLPFDSPDIRAALMIAANDADIDTRDEAIVGLARRDQNAALELLRPLLNEEVGEVLLEAATILGDRSLVPALKAMEEWEGSDYIREQLHSAVAACEAGQGIDHAKSDLVRQHRLSE